MSTTDSPVTLIELLHRRARDHAKEIAFYDDTPAGWRGYSNQAFLEDVLALACILEKKGITARDRLAIMGRPSYAWEVCDKAIMYLGAISVGLDDKAGPHDLSHILQTIEAKILCCDSSKLIQQQMTAEQIANFELIIVFNPASATDKAHLYIPLQTMLEEGHQWLKECPTPLPICSITANTISALAFTSGTTGIPKGIPMTQRQLTCSLPLMEEIFFQQKDSKHQTLAWVPLHNGTGRMMSTVNYFLGCTQYFVKDPSTLFDKIKQIAPTYIVLMPRLLEKVYSAVQEQLNMRPWWMRQFLRILLAWHTHSMPPYIAQWFERKLRTPLREKIWGHQMQFIICGSAPIDPKILRFFDSLGVPTYEVYGLSEIGTLISMNRPNQICYGSVGQPLPNQEVVLAEDGEVLVRSPYAILHYWNAFASDAIDPELYTPEGYFRTGDLGQWRNGFLYLIGRKKEIIKTSTGQRISPAGVEAAFLDIAGIANFIAIGNGRKFLSALIALEPSFVEQSKKQNRHLENYLTQEIAMRNKMLSPVQQIKKFALLPQPLSIEAGEITPSLKTRRIIVEKKYHDLIEQMYQS